MNQWIAWPVFAVVMTAAAIDTRTRRIPNWLTLPALVAGMATNIALAGWAGFGQSVAGCALAVLLLCGLCWIRAMGLGDLKLCAAVGAWIGPAPLLFALVITAMAGGILVVARAAWRGDLNLLLDRTANLSLPDRSKGFHDFHSAGLTIPYAPAIAAGVLFSYFAG